MKKTILIVLFVFILTACSKEESVPGHKIDSTDNIIGGGKGKSYVLKEDEIVDSGVDLKWSWTDESNMEKYKDLESTLRFSMTDAALNLSDETGLYVSNRMIRAFNLYTKGAEIYYCKFYILNKEMEQLGYVGVLFDKGKYKSFDIAWEKDKFYEIIKEKPEEKYILLSSDYKNWALDKAGNIYVGNSTDPDATLSVEGSCYDKLLSLGLGSAYEKVTSSEVLIWISKD